MDSLFSMLEDLWHFLPTNNYLEYFSVVCAFLPGRVIQLVLHLFKTLVLFVLFLDNGKTQLYMSLVSLLLWVDLNSWKMLKKSYTNSHIVCIIICINTAPPGRFQYVVLCKLVWITESITGHCKASAIYLEKFETGLGFKRVILLPSVKAWSVVRRWQQESRQWVKGDFLSNTHMGFYSQAFSYDLENFCI